MKHKKRDPGPVVAAKHPNSPENAGPDRIETKCHMIETRAGNISGRRLVASRGIVLLDTNTDVRKGIKITTYSYVCRWCQTVLNFDSARAVETVKRYEIIQDIMDAVRAEIERRGNEKPYPIIEMYEVHKP